MSIDKLCLCSYESLGLILKLEGVTTCFKQFLVRLAYLHFIRFPSLSGFRDQRDVCSGIWDNSNARRFISMFYVMHSPSRSLENRDSPVCTKFKESSIKMIEKIGQLVTHLKVDSYSKVSRELVIDWFSDVCRHIDGCEEWRKESLDVHEMKFQKALGDLYKLMETADSDRWDQYSMAADILRRRSKKFGKTDMLKEFDLQHKMPPRPTTFEIFSSRFVCKKPSLTTEELAHELLINPLYQLEDPVKESGKEVAITKWTIQWNVISEDYMQGKLDGIMRILGIIADAASEFANPATRQEIADVIDVVHIRSQIENQAFSWTCCQNLFGNIVGIYLKIRPSYHEAETSSMWKSWLEKMKVLNSDGPKTAEEMGEIEKKRAETLSMVLKFLLYRINSIRIMIANNGIRVVSMLTRESLAGFELKKFRDKTDNGEMGYTDLKKWLIRFFKTLPREVLSSIASKNVHSMISAHRSAILSLINGTLKITSRRDVPETLALDLMRIVQLHEKFEVFVKQAVFISTLRTFAPSKAADTAMDHILHILDSSVSEPGYCDNEGLTRWWTDESYDACKSLVAEYSNGDPNILPKYEAAVQSCISNDADAVHVLMRRRVGAIWEAILLDYTITTTSRAELPPMPGMEKLVIKYRKWAIETRVMITVNRAVYGCVYNYFMPLVAQNILSCPL